MIDPQAIRSLRIAGILTETDPERRERIIADALRSIDPWDREAALEIIARSAEVIRLAMAPTIDRARP